MMNVSCNVIKDLLPLYVEEVVSEDTQTMVAEHLAHCADCRKHCEKLKETVAVPMETAANPLKRIKKAWKRKKIFLIFCTLVVSLAVMAGTLLAVEHFVYREKIAVNGEVYVQKGRNIPVLAEDCVEIGYLRRISYWNTGDPTEDLMGTNLDGKYGGCPIYQSGDNDQVIYLQDYSGYYIPFVLED